VRDRGIVEAPVAEGKKSPQLLRAGGAFCLKQNRATADSPTPNLLLP